MWDDPKLTPDRLLAAAIERIMESQFADWVRELDRPHVVVCKDPFSGSISLQGPYPTALAAASAAERDRQSEETQPESERMTFTVAPLLSPHDPDAPGATRL